GGSDRRNRAWTVATTTPSPRRRAEPLLAMGRRRHAVDADRVLAAANPRAPPDLPRRRRRARRRPPALRRPEGRPAGPDAAAGRPLRHPCPRAPMAPPGPSSEGPLDA